VWRTRGASRRGRLAAAATRDPRAQLGSEQGDKQARLRTSTPRAAPR
jgi:hypothetical protein